MKKKNPPYNILILPAGGARGAFQAAAVIELIKAGYEFDAVFGVSVGALNGAMVAQDKIPQLVGIWRQLMTGNRRIFNSEFLTQGGKIRWTGFLKNLFRMGKVEALADPSPLMEILSKYIDRESFKKPFFCSAVAVHGGQCVDFSVEDFHHSEELAKAILASAAIPMIFPPVSVMTKDVEYPKMMDGGIRDAAPISQAIKFARDKSNALVRFKRVNFVIVHCHPRDEVTPSPEKINLKTMFQTMFHVMLNEIWRTDWELFKARNALDGFRTFDTEFFSPPSGVEMPSALDFRPESLRKSWELGQDIGLQLTEEI